MPLETGTLFVVRWIFEDTHMGRGWSEGWVYGVGTHADAITSSEACLLKRLDLSHSKVYCRFARCSDLAIRGDGLVKAYGDTKQGTRLAVGDWDADKAMDTDMCILLDVRSNNFRYRSQKFIHGLDAAIHVGGQLNISGDNGTQLTAYKNALQSAGVRWMRRNTGDDKIDKPFVPENAASLTFTRITDRRTGRPFDPRRGRKRVA